MDQWREHALFSTVHADLKVFRVVGRIFEKWHLGDVSIQGVLGLDPKALQGLRDGTLGSPVTEEFALRLASVLRIYEVLGLLIPDSERANDWIGAPNSASLFCGLPPIDFILEQKLKGLLGVVAYLEGQLTSDFA